MGLIVREQLVDLKLGPVSTSFLSACSVLPIYTCGFKYHLLAVVRDVIKKTRCDTERSRRKRCTLSDSCCYIAVQAIAIFVWKDCKRYGLRGRNVLLLSG